jgi:mannose-1-phosphate guanylyltransferase
MKAFLLVAGKGTRLRPLTDTIPKCLVPIKGKPLLRIWLELLKKHGITDVLINLHYLPDMVADYLAKDDSGVKVTTSYEPALLGSAGTVRANRAFVENERCFFIIYGDNLTDVNLTKMAQFHISHNSVFTIGLFRTNKPQQSGIAEIDQTGFVRSFVEKPAYPKSDLANAGIYVSGTGLFDLIPKKSPADFGFDVLPVLAGRMHGYVIDEFLMDIGSFENYETANKKWGGL